MTVRTLCLVVTLLLTSACATNTPAFCNAAAWQDIGYNHALEGRVDQAHETANSCATKDAPLAYRAGFDYGLAKYCTFRQGLFSGKHGKAPVESCSEPQWDEYQNGYLMGHKIHAASSRLESLSSELEAARYQLWKLSNDKPITPTMQVAIASLQQQIDQLEKVRQDESQFLAYLRTSTTGH